MHEVFVKLLENSRSRESVNSNLLPQWLYRVGHNLSIDVIRKNRRIIASPAGEEIPDNRLEYKNAVEDIFCDELRENMRRIAFSMDESGQYLLLMEMLMDSTIDQKKMSDALGVSIRTLQRMTEKLFRKMDQELKKYASREDFFG